MPRAKVLYDEVREAQALLGRGEVDEAMDRAAPLLGEALELLERRGALTSYERNYAAGAAVFATITLILGAAESSPPPESVPRIRELAIAAVARHGRESETWKVLAAAAEMLARSGDAAGAAWAAKKAMELGPDEDYLVKMAGGIRSMYPQVFAEAAEPPPDRPPDLPTPGDRGTR